MSSGREFPLTAEEQALLDLFKNNRALIKMIPDVHYDFEGKKRIIDYSEVDYYLEQLAGRQRPSRSEYFFEVFGKPFPESLKKLNLKTKKIHDHHPGQCRHTKHGGVDFKYIPKTSTSLLPSEPQFMRVFSEDAIGFIWDINDCLIKNKYIFAQNAGTFGCFWFVEYNKGYTAPVVSEDEIRANNDAAVKAKKTIYWNEFLASPPIKCAPKGILAPQDTHDIRLRSWAGMLRTKDYLEHDSPLPIAIVQSQFINDHRDPEDERPDRPGVVRIYTAEERKTENPAQLQFCSVASASISFFRPRVARTLPQETKLQRSLLSGFIGFERT